jgi:4-amino-4-deoxy-L-arabinose transferase-like glycosyltransferase
MALLFLVAAPHPWSQRWRRGVLAAVVFLLVAMLWVLAVEWTPVEKRPYIGGSTTNSIIELIFDYNGFDRLWGENWSYFLGDPGILRLFNGQLGGQIGWLMVVALGGLMLAIWQYRSKISPMAQRQRQRHSLILWAGWLGLGIFYFSSSTFFHRYYLATMAPAVAALVGIGAAALWSVRTIRWGKMAWVTAVILCASPQIGLLMGYPAWRVWLVPLILGLSLVSILLIITRSAYRVAAVIFVLTIYMTPVVWSAIPVFSCTDMTLPTGGPQEKQCRPFEERPFLDEVLVDYLVSSRDGAKFMAATYDMGIAEFGIMETGQPFMALGGYRGSDPILSLDQFTEFVAAGDVRYFISMTEPGETFPQQEAIRQWVGSHCPLVSLELDGIELRGPCSSTDSQP